MQKARTFEDWKVQVDAYIIKVCGLSSDDIEDWHYRDYYDDGIGPKETALDALANAGYTR